MRISIIIASFGEAYWENLARRRPLPSAEAQTAPAHEIIVVHHPEGTLAEARNEGARRAKGDYLCFLDADDELEPEFCAEMQRALKTVGEQMALLTPAVKYYNGRVPAKSKMWPRMDIRNGNWMIIGTLVPRKLFHKAGGFREYELYEDWALWGKCMNAGAVAIEVPDAIYVAYIKPKSRNRGKSRATMNYWHQKIGCDNWPDVYEVPSEQEDSQRALLSGTVRRLAA